MSLIVLAQGAGALAAQGVYVLIPYWKVAFGLSQAGAGALITALSLGQLLALLFLGRLVDDFGERRILGLSLMALGGACCLTLVLPDRIESIFLSVFLWGLFYAAGQPSGAKAIVSWFPSQGRGLAIGLHQAAVPLGATVAALLLPTLAETGWRRSVWLMAIVTGAAGAAMLLVYKRKIAPKADGKAPVDSHPLRFDWRFRVLLGVGILMTGVQFTFAAHGVIFMAERYRLGFVEAAALFSVTQIVAIPARIVLPSAVERFWPGRVSSAVAVINLVGVGSIALAIQLAPGSDSAFYIMTMLAIGLFAMGWYPVYLLQLTGLAAPEFAGRIIGLVTVLCMISRLAGPPVFGLVVDVFGYGPAWLGLLAPAALFTAPLLWLRLSPITARINLPASPPPC